MPCGAGSPAGTRSPVRGPPASPRSGSPHPSPIRSGHCPLELEHAQHGRGLGEPETGSCRDVGGLSPTAYGEGVQHAHDARIASDLSGARARARGIGCARRGARWRMRGFRRAGLRARPAPARQQLHHIVGRRDAHRLGLAEETVAPRRRRARHRTRYGPERPLQRDRVVRRVQRPAARTCLDDDGGRADRRDEAIAQEEPPARPASSSGRTSSTSRSSRRRARRAVSSG